MNKKQEELQELACKIQPNVVLGVRTVMFSEEYIRVTHNTKVGFKFMPAKAYDALISYHPIVPMLVLRVVKDERTSFGFKFTFVLQNNSFERLFKDWSILNRRTLIEKKGFYI